MKYFLTRRMFWIMLLILIYAGCTYQPISIGAWDLNRSIGWGWDLVLLHTWSFTFLMGSLVLFLLGYGVLFWTKKNTRFFISILHLIFLAGYLIIPPFHIFVHLLLGILVWVIYILNLLFSWKTTRGN